MTLFPVFISWLFIYRRTRNGMKTKFTQLRVYCALWRCNRWIFKWIPSPARGTSVPPDKQFRVSIPIYGNISRDLWFIYLTVVLSKLTLHSICGVYCFFLSHIFSYFCFLLLARRPCHGRLPLLKYSITYPSDSRSSRRLREYFS